MLEILPIKITPQYFGGSLNIYLLTPECVCVCVFYGKIYITSIYNFSQPFIHIHMCMCVYIYISHIYIFNSIIQ